MMLLVALGPLNLGVADSCGLSFQPTQEFPPNASEHETRTYVNLFLITQVQLYRRLKIQFKRLDESYKRRIFAKDCLLTLLACSRIIRLVVCWFVTMPKISQYTGKRSLFAPYTPSPLRNQISAKK